MEEHGDRVQALMDEVYDKWQKDENKGKSKWDVLGGFSEAHQIAVVFGNFNNQVCNGGISQWITNGYFHDDSEKIIDFLEIGAEFDARCRTILDRVYKLDEYAQETECDRHGSYNDENGDFCSIDDMIDCDLFDTWYYDKCNNDNWWQVVSQIIDRVEEREPAPNLQDEHGGETNAARHPISVYIENVHDDRIGGFTIPLPTTPKALQPFLDGAEITGWQDMKIWEALSDIGDLGDMISDGVSKTMSPDTLDELNYLAAKIQALTSGGFEIFAAALEAKRHCGSVAEIINLTFDENINRFDLLPALSNEEYGDFLIEQVGVDAHADAFNRLESSDDPDDKALAKYIEKLEKYADRRAYGRDAIKEENGAITEYGLLVGGDGIEELYRGSQDIPAEYRLFSQQGEIVKPLIKIENTDIAAAVVKICAVSGDHMAHGAAAEILKEITTGQDKDYLLTVNTNGIHFYPAMDAYKRGDGPAGVITSLTGEPGTRFFALSVNSENIGITGDIVELNRDAFRANAARHHITPDRIDATMTDGSKQTYHLWDWAVMPDSDRGQIAGYEPHYSDGDIRKAHGRFDSFRSACADECKTVSEGEFIADINSAYMAAASNPQPDMIRIASPAAAEILTRNDADVYRLIPSGLNKLAPIEAVRIGRHAEHGSYAMKREDISGLDKWAKNAADTILQQNERGKQEKSKNKREEL